MTRSSVPAWRRRVRTWWRQIKNEDATPRGLGIAVAVGVLIGCSPFWGLQLALALLVAWIFRLNKLAVLIGAQVSTPPFTPLFIVGTAQLGELLLRGQWLALSVADVRAARPLDLFTHLFGSMLAGSLVIGGALGLALGAATSAVVHRHRERRANEATLSEQELDALTDRLTRLPPYYRNYGWWKVRLDPVYAMALAAVDGAAEVVDLGAGIGLMAAVLVGRTPRVRVRAVEWDPRKVAMARRLLDDAATVAIDQMDARVVNLASPDAILLLDVLHYVPAAEQRAWLERCVDALAPGGLLVIRELDSSAAKGGGAERLDRIAVWLGMNRGGGVHPWAIEEMTGLLRAHGFDVSLQPAGRGMWAANALVVARKPGAPDSGVLRT